VIEFCDLVIVSDEYDALAVAAAAAAGDLLPARIGGVESSHQSIRSSGNRTLRIHRFLRSLIDPIIL